MADQVAYFSSFGCLVDVGHLVERALVEVVGKLLNDEEIYESAGLGELLSMNFLVGNQVHSWQLHNELAVLRVN